MTYTAGASGSVNLTLVVTNASGCSASGNATAAINANPATPTITPAASAVCTLSTGNTASGPAGATTYLWGITNGTITGGGSTQTVTYTAGASGNVQLTLEVTNASGCSATSSVSVPIDPLPTLDPATGTGFTGTFGTAFSQAFTASGGTGPFTYTINPSTPPAGLSFVGGTLSGPPNATGTFTFTVTATSAVGCASTTQSYTLVVRPNLANDSYSGVGNTQLYITGVAGTPATPAVASATTALANDLPAAGVTVTGVVSPCVGLGGTITIDSAGRFVYTPPVGVTGNDACTYTATSDTGGTGTPASATATITIGLANRVWYVNGAAGAGDGRSHSPFNTLASASTAHASNDTVFVQSGGTATATPGAITMKATTWLWGQGTALPPVGGIAIQNTGATTKPVLSGTVTLGGNSVTVSSLDIATNGATGLTDDQAGAITGITVQNNVTVTATNAAAVVLSDVTSSASGIVLSSVASSGSATSGVSLTNVNGTFTAPAGALSNATNADFLVSGGTANVTWGGTINDDLGVLVAVSSTTGGAKAFTGAISDGNDGDGSGIVLTNNSGASISFSGGIVLSTGGNPAFTATGGGTVVVCDENPCGASGSNGGLVNTLTTTTGTALNVASTTIGASDLEFQSISSNGGTATGIILSATGSTGGLKVKGTGAAGSGGTIQNKAGTDGDTATGIGIYLNQTANVRLDRMQLNGFGNFAIRGFEVAGLSMTGVVVSGTNGNSAAENEGSVVFGAEAGETGGARNGLTGVVSITSCEISGGHEDNLKIRNQSGTLSQLTLTSTTIRDNTTVSPGNNGVLFQADGTANMTVDVVGGSFLRNRANGIQVITNGGGTMDFSTTGGIFTDNNIGVNVAHNSTGTMLFAIGTGTYSATASGKASPINVNLGAVASGPMTGTVSGNTITNANSPTGPGIRVISNGANAAVLTIQVQGNNISQIGNRGIEMIARDGNSVINATVRSNTVTLTDPLSADGIRIDAGAVSTDTTTICADIAQNTSTTIGGLFGVRVRQRFAGTTFRIEGYGGGATDMTAVQNYLSSQNNGATASADFAGAGFQNSGGCPAP